MPAPPILVTGAAGFIGYHVARRLLQDGHTVVGLDNLNAYYDPALKEARLSQLAWHSGLSRSSGWIWPIAREWQRSSHGTGSPVCSISGLRPGIRHSLVDPHSYIESNLVGFGNILEGCRHNGCKHLLYASSSSVFGANTQLPFSVHDNVDHPLNLYAATKKSNELMAHSYAHLFGLPTTGLRFFTVYGPWGQPDMAMWLFADAITRRAPDQALQSWPHAARLHLCRRRGGSRSSVWSTIRRAPIRTGLVPGLIPPRALRPGGSTTSGIMVRSKLLEVVRLFEEAHRH